MVIEDKIKIAKYNPKIDSLEELTRFVQEAYRANVNFFGKEVGEVVVSFLYSREEMDGVRNQKTLDWQVGQTTNDGLYIFSPKVFDKVSSHPKEDFLPVLKHEMAHIFTRKLFNFSNPHWLREGLAGYVAEQYKGRKIDKNKIGGFSDLHASEGWHKGSYYNQAYWFTKYLVDTFGKEKFREFISNIIPTIGISNSFKAFCKYFESFFQKDFPSVQNNWIGQLEKQIKASS
jgi:hypothetical protein